MMTERDAMYRTILMHPEDDTPRRIFADFLEDNGEPELSEFVRVQCELANGHHCVNCGGKGYMGYGSFTATCKWCRPESLRLRSRERELFTAHGREWFGANVGLDRPTPLQLSIAALAGCGWLVPARGFPSHWYGSWEQWVGGECIRCDGDGRAHGADRPFEWSADVEYGKCVVCKGDRKSVV